MARTGRPKGSGSLYTQEQATTICERIDTGETLQAICRDLKLVPRTVYRWMDDHPEFASEFAQARARGFDAIAAQTLEIADDKAGDFTETERGPAFNAEHVQRAKLRIETRLKLLAKWDPKRYGERTELAGSITLKKAAADMTDDELADIAAGKVSRGSKS